MDDLLAPHADEADKPTVVDDSAYADGATRARLEDESYEVIARTPPQRNATGSGPRTGSASTPRPAGPLARPATPSHQDRPHGRRQGQLRPALPRRAHYGRSAPPRAEAEPSRSTLTRPGYSGREPNIEKGGTRSCRPQRSVRSITRRCTGLDTADSAPYGTARTDWRTLSRASRRRKATIMQIEVTELIEDDGLSTVTLDSGHGCCCCHQVFHSLLERS